MQQTEQHLGLRVMMLAKLTAGNDAQATINRARLDQAGAVAVNIIGSPGAGKTALLECTVRVLRADLNCAVIEGDLCTSRDGERVAALGIPVVQINTSGACHLDAGMVSAALEALPIPPCNLILIENVGNLVCPAAFELGERVRVVVLSVPEGHDKVAKYPAAFRHADLVVVSKTDLLEAVDFDAAALHADLRSIGCEAPVLELSAKTGAGTGAWAAWLRGAVGRHLRPERR